MSPLPFSTNFGAGQRHSEHPEIGKHGGSSRRGGTALRRCWGRVRADARPRGVRFDCGALLGDEVQGNTERLPRHSSTLAVFSPSPPSLAAHGPMSLLSSISSCTPFRIGKFRAPQSLLHLYLLRLMSDLFCMLSVAARGLFHSPCTYKTRLIHDFSQPWPLIATFLSALPLGSVGLDVGCGNGKYLGVNPGIFVLASDT